MVETKHDPSGGLRALHAMHAQLQDLRQKLEDGPRRLLARRKLIERREAEFTALRDQKRQLELATERKNLDLKTNEAKIAGLRAKLNMATTNREFDIIRGQIDADTMANSVLEDEILEVLEKVDGAQAAIVEQERLVQAAKADVDSLAAEIGRTESGLRDQATTLAAALRAAEDVHIPATIRSQYDRLVQAHGAAALAAAVTGTCTACYVGLNPQSRVDLNSGKIVFCKSCGRVLYLAAGE